MHVNLRISCISVSLVSLSLNFEHANDWFCFGENTSFSNLHTERILPHYWLPAMSQEEGIILELSTSVIKAEDSLILPVTLWCPLSHESRTQLHLTPRYENARTHRLDTKHLDFYFWGSYISICFLLALGRFGYISLFLKHSWLTLLFGFCCFVVLPLSF